MGRIALTFIIAALLVLGWIALGYGRESLMVDSCLDSSGSFDYATMTCDHRESHPYSPYTQRHPAVPSIVVLAGGVAACGLAGVIFSKRQRQ